MDCNEEVVILERRLKPLDGMVAIAADLIGQRLHVKYDAAKLTTSAMVDVVGQTGMRMWLEHDEPVVSDSIRVRWRLMAVAGTALAVGAIAAVLHQPGVANVLWIAGRWRCVPCQASAHGYSLTDGGHQRPDGDCGRRRDCAR